MLTATVWSLQEFAVSAFVWQTLAPHEHIAQLHTAFHEVSDPNTLRNRLDPCLVLPVVEKCDIVAELETQAEVPMDAQLVRQRVDRWVRLLSRLAIPHSNRNALQS